VAPSPSRASGFKLKLFLEQFGVKAAVLNAELPLNSRWHAIEAFNRGAFDLLIATDDPVLRAPAGTQGGAVDGAAGKRGGKRGKKGKAGDGDGDVDGHEQWRHEFGVSRGIDFQGVTAVINFDLPTSPNVRAAPRRVAGCDGLGTEGATQEGCVTGDG
jgi:ATP-dependent RNA helicase DDX56/DBP9